MLSWNVVKYLFRILSRAFSQIRRAESGLEQMVSKSVSVSVLIELLHSGSEFFAGIALYDEKSTRPRRSDEVLFFFEAGFFSPIFKD